MAGFQGFQGFDFESPEEISAKWQIGLQNALRSGDKDKARMAMATQAAINVSGGTPEFKEAKKKKQILADASKAAFASGTGDEVQQQMNFYAKVQEAAIEAGIPDIAIQATDQLAQLRVLEDERARLKSAEVRAVEAHDLSIDTDTTALDLSRQMVLVDEEGNAITNIDLKTDSERLKEELATNPNARLVTQEDFFDFTTEQLLQRERLAAAQKVAETKNISSDTIGVRKYNESGVTQLNMVQSSNQMTALLTEAPEIFTAEKSLEGAIGNLASQGKAFVNGVFNNGEFEAHVMGRPGWAQIKSAQKKALVMNMAYALATSREGGRLTDQDIDRAIVSLGFLDNPDPRAVAQVMMDNVKAGLASWEKRSLIGDMKHHEPTTYSVVRNSYLEGIAAIETLQQKLGGGYDFEEAKPTGTVIPSDGSVTVVEIPDGT